MDNNFSWSNGRDDAILNDAILEALASKQQRSPSPTIHHPASNFLVTNNAPASASAAMQFAQAPAAAPSNLGEIEGRDQLARQQQQQQQQQPFTRRKSRPTQLYSPEALPAANSSAPSKAKTFTQATKATEGGEQSTNHGFPKKLFRALQDAKYPGALGWSTDGKSFYINRKDSKMLDFVWAYFKVRKYISWYRQLITHGWSRILKGKNKGFMYNKHFHRDMGRKNFKAILPNKLEARTEQSAKKKEKPKEKSAKSKKASVIASKKNKDKSIKAAPTKKIKGKKTTKVISKKKSDSKIEISSENNKKRKDPPNSQDAVDTNETKKKRSSTDEMGEDKRALKFFKEHKRLHDIFWKWNMWNFPEGLDTFLENGKVRSLTNKKKITKANAGDEEPDIHCDYKEDEIAHLLCDEEMPGSIIDEQDDKQALADFVNRIRKDRQRQHNLKELWSNSDAPVVKGKILAQSRFIKPNDKWKKLKVGDRIGVFWRDDAIFYNAIIKKQQGNTTYFHLMYDDDGAQEWLDMSRESFKFNEVAKKPVTVVHSTPRREARRTLIRVSDETPLKDNRARSNKEDPEESKHVNLPDNYAHLAPFVRYSWKGLGLGSDAGTPSYNSFIKQRDALAPRVSALELLNDMRSLRSSGFSGIPLQLYSENASNDMDNSNHNENDKLTNQLRYLQDKISKDNDVPSSGKHYNQTLNAVRKLTDEWDIPMVRENLRTIETQVLRLNARESVILEKCKQKGMY